VNLPVGNISLLVKEINKYSFSNIKKNTFVLITLPTPKQEIIAKKIFNQNSAINILCLGGALNMASGYEKPIPNFFEDLGLEFLWRLRTDPIRRTWRLLASFFKAIIYGIFFRNEYEFKQK
jgi:Teichoic acid biosynthesis proteins